MLRSIAAAMGVLWLLSIAGSYTMGGWIHILPGIAIILVLIDIIRDRWSLGKKHKRHPV